MLKKRVVKESFVAMKIKGSGGTANISVYILQGRYAANLVTGILPITISDGASQGDEIDIEREEPQQT
jgi:hypothetical protein